MSVRTVRLDQNSEKILHHVIEMTGLPISKVIKEGLKAFEKQLMMQSFEKTPYEIYKSLGPIPGDEKTPPSTDVRKAVRAVLRRKYKK